MNILVKILIICSVCFANEYFKFSHPYLEFKIENQETSYILSSNRGYNLLEYENQSWAQTDSSWQTSSKYSYTYDDDHNQTTWLAQSWDGINLFKYSYTYDDDGNEIESIYKIWNLDNLEWMNIQKSTRTYQDGDWTEMLTQSWDGNQWINNTKLIFIYEDGYVVEYFQQLWSESEWEDHYKATVIYENGQVIEAISQTWVDFGWQNYIKSIYAYNDNDNMTEFLIQSWNGYNWINSTYYLYTYDIHYNQIENLVQTWDESEWINWLKTSSTYDNDNNLIEALTLRWNDTDWENNSRTANYIYEENNLDINFDHDIDLSYNLHASYPNPFNPNTTISFTIPNHEFASIKIYSLNGQLITTLAEGYFNQGSHYLTWNAANTPSGKYFVRMKSNAYNKTQIITLIK